MGQNWDKLKTDQLIKARGLSYGDIGRALRPPVTRQGVGHWFRDRGEPDMEQIKQMASRLGVHWIELVDEKATLVNDPVEAELLTDYRELDQAEREQARDYMNFLRSKRGQSP